LKNLAFFQKNIYIYTMKLLKTFACAAVASLVLLACSDNTNSSNEPTSCSQVRKRSNLAQYIFSITEDVKAWMDEQIASGGKEQKLISISITDWPLLKNPMEEPEVSGTYNSTTGESVFFVNGQEMTIDEHKEFMADYDIKKAEHNAKVISDFMASVSVPGEEVEMLSNGWKALMTAEDIIKLKETNEGLAISFFNEGPAPYEPELGGGGAEEASSLRCP
jgi:hypothetical protein